MANFSVTSLQYNFYIFFSVAHLMGLFGGLLAVPHFTASLWVMALQHYLVTCLQRLQYSLLVACLQYRLFMACLLRKFSDRFIFVLR